MSCTTILAGRKATNDGSTMISRTDDGFFDEKKIIVVQPHKQPKVYKTVNSYLSIELPANPLRYTSSPSINTKNGVWPATGINEAHVGMTATETITSNPRVLAADPLVVYDKESKKAGGIGEEDIVLLVLPYIRTAREGVLRLAELLEKYGTYESNGIAFNDEEEVWWLETIGGHHWIAQKLKDEEVVINPNQFGMDHFDLDDAFGAKNSNLCSADLKEFIKNNHLDLNNDGIFNPRNIFGSHSDLDHIYNTPRAWYMGRCLCPFSYKWDGENADFTPISDNIPWSFIPDRKVTVEDIAYIMSSHYQNTAYDPYSSQNTGKKGIYRSIGINRTGITSICQLRKGLEPLEWVCFGSTTFSAFVPLYTNVNDMPAYFKNVTLDVSTENLYWSSRLLGALADGNYASSIAHIERYQQAIFIKGREIVNRYDSVADKDLEKANAEIAKMVKKETTAVLNKVLKDASMHMKNGFNRADN